MKGGGPMSTINLAICKVLVRSLTKERISLEIIKPLLSAKL